ncbi:MAG: hypothetical protein ACJAWV_001821 [Flammeovirgaceae bacterium]|jgi:hypothetical protein
MNNRIEIEFSKTKILLALIGSIVFVVFGFLFILKSDMFVSSLASNMGAIKVIGFVSVTFFGFCLIIIVRKLLDNKMGLTIDENGINDNSSATSVGLINWEDILRVETLEIASTKTLIIFTDKPDKYINKARNGFYKKTIKINHKMCDSPISITSNTLKIKHDDLEKLIAKELERRKNIYE